METQQSPPRTTTARFVRAVTDFASSEVGGKAKWAFAALFALLCGVNGLNVVNSYVGRNFMTSIADRNNGEFIRQAIFYVGVFGASTVVAVVARFVEERLGLLWRESLTKRAIGRYLANGAYYRLDASGELANPDQRIAEDIRAFTGTTLAFVLMLLNSSFTIIAFSGVLWSISPFLFIVAVSYAACGSLLTFVLGRPLIKLNYHQLDKEAEFRSALIDVRQNAESIALARREDRHSARLLYRLEDLIANFRRITSINRNVGFATTGYNWLVQIIPALVVAPAFIAGKIDFGAISQSSVAFTALVAAFSLIVTQFQSISTFAAVVARLSSMMEVIEKSQTAAGSNILIVEAEGPLRYEHLTLLSPGKGDVLLKDLSILIPDGLRVLLTASEPVASLALVKATVGVPTSGTGRITRPGADAIYLLAQRPYLPPGTLRQALDSGALKMPLSENRILELMRELELEPVLAQAGGLDTEQEWGTLLSLREQQLLAVMRTLLAAPRFVFLDRISAVLSPNDMRKILHMLRERSITYINCDAAGAPAGFYDAILQCQENGAWTWTQIAVAESEANANGAKAPS